MQQCKQCSQGKAFSQYYKKDENRYDTTCKSCRSTQAKQRYIKNPQKEKERGKKYREENRDKYLQRLKRYRENNKEKCAEIVRRSREKRKEYYLTKWKAYRDAHKTEHNEYCNEATKNLSDWYVRNLLTRNKGSKKILKNEEISQELVDLKRLQIILLRSTRCKQNL